MTKFVILISLIAAIPFTVYRFFFGSGRWKKPEAHFPASWRKILFEEVIFYTRLPDDEKHIFEYKVAEFLQNVRITGIKTSVDDIDKLLVASSAVIPIFAFPDWQYYGLKEVLVYPAHFDEKFQVAGKGRNILGMVGTGYMNGKMILSQSALRQGFRNESDKKNTAIHEFVHLLDKADGIIDGVPEVLLQKQYVLPWLDLVEKKMEEINSGKTDINGYGGTSKVEFFAVLGEYFFERPRLLKQNHPKLYHSLETMFRQELADKAAPVKQNEIGRNDPCPCGSGKKFKKCCGEMYYA